MGWPCPRTLNITAASTTTRTISTAIHIQVATPESTCLKRFIRDDGRHAAGVILPALREVRAAGRPAGAIITVCALNWCDFTPAVMPLVREGAGVSFAHTPTTHLARPCCLSIHVAL